VRKFLWFIAVLIVTAIGAVLAAPNFIDWNQYKGMATDKVRELTGRELTIDGKIHIAIWPAPALIAEDISFSNFSGGQSPNMASIKTVEVRVALAPLLSGQIKVETVKLIEPIIELERLADGSANWDITIAEETAKSASAAVSQDTGVSSPSSGAPDFVLDNFTIENGTLIYRDGVNGLTETIENLNAKVAAASLQGPIETSGSMVLRRIPLSYSASLGEIIHDRTVPFNARITLQAGDLTAQAGGSIVNLLKTPQFKGSIKVDGKDLGAALSALGMPVRTPGAALPVQLSGQILASVEALQIKDLAVTLASIQAKGDLQVDLGDKPRFGSQLAINRIDTDKLLAALKPALTSKAATNAAAQKPTAKSQPKPKPKAESGPIRFSIPTDIAGSLILTVDAIGHKDGVIRDVLLNAELAEGRLRLGQFSAQFPGGSDLAVMGELQTPKQVPTFTGEIETTINDLRGVLSWLSVTPPPVPADRLRKLSLKSQIKATPEQVQVTGLDLKFDSSRLQGGVTVALRKRIGFGAAVVLDRLNVDAYLPASKSTQKPKPAAGKTKPAAKPKPSSRSTQAAVIPLSALAALNTFDANFSVHVKSAIYNRAAIKDLVAEGTLYNGALDFKRLSVGKLAGASARISGKILGLSEVPSAKNLRFSAKVPNLTALARLSGTKLPPAAKKLGAVTLKGRLDGSLIAPTIDTVTTFASATATYKGRLSALSLGDMLSGKITLRHKNLLSLLRRLGVDYRPKGKLGALDLAAEIKGGADKINLKSFQARIGKTSIGGTVSAVLSGAKPLITANLKTSALNIVNFLPAQKNAALKGLVPTLIPAAWRPPSTGVAGTTPLLQHAARGQWSTKPLDLSALNLLDADIQLRTPILIYGRYLAENADIVAKINNGILRVEKLSAKLFGGTLLGNAEAAAVGNRIQSNVKVTGLNVENALVAVTGEAAANGKVDFALDVTSGGRSVAAIIQALNGRGNFALSNMDVRKATKGSLISGLLGLFTSLNKLGGKSGSNKGSVNASFDINRGIATTNDLKLASSFGNGAAAGNINLPRWTIDLNGEILLAESFLTRLLKAKVRESRNAVPFSITGSLEAPNVKVDTNAALGAGIPIPGADALLNKAPKGVGNILRGILGGGSQPKTSPPPTSGSQPPPANTPPPPPSDQQQPQQINPQNLLKKLFKL
jgi:uncharacterized protein involved in outer membrane biogenesis